MPGVARLARAARRRAFVAYGKAFGRKTVFHVTPAERAGSIRRQGLREGAPENWTRAVNYDAVGRPGRPPGVFVGNLHATGGMRFAGPTATAAKLDPDRVRAAVDAPHTLFRVRVKRSRLGSDPDWAGGGQAPFFKSYTVRGRIAPKHIRETDFSTEYKKWAVKRVAVGAGGTTAVVSGVKARRRRKGHVA